MKVEAIKTKLIEPGQDLVAAFLQGMQEVGKNLSAGDIVVVAETVVATSQGRVVNLKAVKDVTPRARVLAEKYDMDPRVAQLVVSESEEILGGVQHVLLARAGGLLLANAGIDASNSGGENLVSLLPEDPWGAIRSFKEGLERATGTRPLGAILADSRVQPLKKGVIGGALAVSGFNPVIDKRGQVDLFGRPLVMTQIAVADDLTSAAEAVMGEADERTPFVLIKDAPVVFTSDDEIDKDAMRMAEEECLFINVFKELAERKMKKSGD